MSLIVLKDIYKTYQVGLQSQDVLRGVSLSINQGEMVALMGASGSGKSTIMNMIGLLDRPSKGQYYLNGQAVSNLSEDEMATLRNQTIGFVFQQFFLLSKLTAKDNVAMPLHYRGLSNKEIKERVLFILEQVGMADYANRRPNELSGGQQQRVAIARALVGEPNIILADEPTGALDSKTSSDVMDLLHELHEKEKRTLLIVTHDPLVGSACKRQINISDGLIAGDQLSCN